MTITDLVGEISAGQGYYWSKKVQEQGPTLHEPGRAPLMILCTEEPGTDWILLGGMLLLILLGWIWGLTTAWVLGGF